MIKNMNILFITEDHTPKNSGVTTVVSQLANELILRGSNFHPSILAVGDDAVSQNERIPIYLIKPSKIGSSWGWSPALQKKILEVVESRHIDVIHIHGVWMAAQLLGFAAARKKHIPHIVSIHGMLEPWFWGASLSPLKRFKKYLYLCYFLYPNVSSDAVIHAITPLEKTNLRKFFPRQKITVIPNAIPMPEPYGAEQSDDLEKNILYLGRLHPKKGVDLLIRAFHQAALGKAWQLVIAGQAESLDYLNYLKNLTSELQLTLQVKFIGAVFDEQKQDILRKSWVMVAPSYSEVIGMVNLEAAKCRLPSITTCETGLLNWEEGGGALIHPNVDDLTRALRAASNWSLSERIERGQKSYQFVNKKYSWDVVFPAWEKLYTDVFEKR